MRYFIIVSLFTISVLQLPGTTTAQTKVDELTGIKPKWNITEMHTPAFFPAAGNMISWSEGVRRSDLIKYQQVVVQELRTVNLETGQKSVQPIAVQPRNIKATAVAFKNGEMNLSLVNAVDGSVYLTVESRPANLIADAQKLPLQSRSQSVAEVILWDGKTLKPLDRQLYPNLGTSRTTHTQYPRLVDISPDGTQAAMWAEVVMPDNRREYRICRFDLSEKKVTPKDQGISFPGNLWALKVLNNGTVLISCDEQRIRDDAGGSEISRQSGFHLLTPDGKLNFLWNKERFRATEWMAVSPDSKLIALVEPFPTNREEIQLFDASTGKSLGKVSGGPFEDPQLAFSPDGKYLAIGTDSGGQSRSYVLLYNLKTKQFDKRFDVSPYNYNRYGTLTRVYGTAGVLKFSPDGKWLNWQRIHHEAGFYSVWLLE